MRACVRTCVLTYICNCNSSPQAGRRDVTATSTAPVQDPQERFHRELGLPGVGEAVPAEGDASAEGGAHPVATKGESNVGGASMERLHAPVCTHSSAQTIFLEQNDVGHTSSVSIGAVVARCDMVFPTAHPPDGSGDHVLEREEIFGDLTQVCEGEGGEVRRAGGVERGPEVDTRCDGGRRRVRGSEPSGAEFAALENKVSVLVSILTVCSVVGRGVMCMC